MDTANGNVSISRDLETVSGNGEVSKNARDPFVFIDINVRRQMDVRL